jgi:nitrogen fixation NifU-like protein
MSDLRDLYQSVILDHYKKPRNYGALEAATGSANGVNPLCGDHVTVHVRVDGDTVESVGFEGNGCAISTASASLMTEIVAGRSVAESEAIFERFHDFVTGGAELETDGLGKLEVLLGVREFPARVKCATLAWHALRAAIAGGHEEVTTE